MRAHLWMTVADILALAIRSHGEMAICSEVLFYACSRSASS